MASCSQVSSVSHQSTRRGGGWLGPCFVAVSLLFVASCDPITGTGPGTPPSPSQYLHVDAAAHTVVVTLIAGHPATDNQFNYDGYSNGALVLTVPVGWKVTVQCQNHGTVPNSCAVVSGGAATKPVDPGWSTPDPQRGLDPGQSASFEFTASQPGSYRIASLVGGNEASGMWADLQVPASGTPSIRASGS